MFSRSSDMIGTP